MPKQQEISNYERLLAQKNAGYGVLEPEYYACIGCLTFYSRLNTIQTGLDVAGIADPTGIVDFMNAFLYLGTGQWKDAAISGLGIFPYVGDVGKVARLGSKAAKMGGNVLSKAELLRIENAATRINKSITVVGSRASGKAGPYADWDYVIDGGINSREWSKIKNSLPGARSILDNTPRNIDILPGPIWPNSPHITIYPR